MVLSPCLANLKTRRKQPVETQLCVTEPETLFAVSAQERTSWQKVSDSELEEPKQSRTGSTWRQNRTWIQNTTAVKCSEFHGLQERSATLSRTKRTSLHGERGTFFAKWKDACWIQCSSSILNLFWGDTQVIETI